ncbi:MAG: class I SAM-dependent methyltransferase [Bacteroidota bacterium]
MNDTKAGHSQKMTGYYRFQSKIYDATRWSFLFGRKRLVRKLPIDTDAEINILEVGCGTGANLLGLAKRFPKAQLIGIDVSEDMLRLSAKKTQPFANRVTLLEGYYGQLPLPTQPDVIIFSYCLTMVNPGWDKLIEQAYLDLNPGGLIGVTDFHASAVPGFKRHMGNHHVRMDGHLLPVLEQRFTSLQSEVKKAYGGVWEFLHFVGRK